MRTPLETLGLYTLQVRDYTQSEFTLKSPDVGNVDRTCVYCGDEAKQSLYHPPKEALIALQARIPDMSGHRVFVCTSHYQKYRAMSRNSTLPIDFVEFSKSAKLRSERKGDDLPTFYTSITASIYDKSVNPPVLLEEKCTVWYRGFGDGASLMVVDLEAYKEFKTFVKLSGVLGASVELRRVLFDEWMIDRTIDRKTNDCFIHFLKL